jgi:galactokinase
LSAPTHLESRARQHFRDAFGDSPTAVVVAPGRINIIGEHTDYNGGFVMPAAIDRYVAVALRLRSDSQINLWSDRYPTPVHYDRRPSSRQGAWPDYVLGVATEIDRRWNASPGFDAIVVADLPPGSGLGSSGALEVATALSLTSALGLSAQAIDVAGLCQSAENDFVGARTGIMDQFATLFSRAGFAILLDSRSLAREHVELPAGEFAWLLADTGVRHELASSSYNDRRADCARAAAALGMTSLRDASEADLARLDDPVLRRRARHVVTENARVLAAADTLRQRAPRGLGPLLYASHDSLRRDFEVSCRELDCLVELAARMPAVVGARMMGGGFGGCALVLAEAENLDDLEKALADGYVEQFHRAPEFYRVHSVDGVTR